VAVVTETGMNTALGHIAHLVSDVKEDETPLQKQMRVLGRDVTVLAVSHRSACDDCRILL
jgi:Ca2+-transporting ATPase